MDDPEDTPIDLGLRRNASRESKALANCSLCLNAIARQLGEAASCVDKLEGTERAGYLAGLARQLGLTGDELHEARRIIEDMSRETT